MKNVWEIKKDELIIPDFSEFNHWLDSEGIKYEKFLQDILDEYGDLWLDETHRWRISDELRWLDYLDSQAK